MQKKLHSSTTCPLQIEGIQMKMLQQLDKGRLIPKLMCILEKSCSSTVIPFISATAECS